jgi:TonB family protein
VSSPYAWYLAGVQAKVWTIWASQVHPEFVTPVEVQFTILEDGSLAEPPVVAPSGNIALDLAATRAIVSAAPFAPLPKDMKTKPFTIRAHFKPDH